MQHKTHTFGRNLLRYSAIAIALASPALVAQSDPKFGISASVAMPMGSLSDVAGPGFSVGAFYEMPLFEGLVQNMSVQYTSFGTKKTEISYIYSSYSFDTSVSSFSAHYDLNYYLGPSLYALAGLSYHSYSVTVKGGGISISSDIGEIDTKAALNIGGGFNLTQSFGIEGKFVLAGDPFLQLSARLRF